MKRVLGMNAGHWGALVVCAALAFGTRSAVAADGVDQLRQFVTATRSAEGSFEQVVTAKSGRKPQQSEGSFAFSRPGKFRWQYELPYQQLLVGDGEKLWSWDKDLNQVTVKRLGDALGATPAAILFGGSDLEQNFELSDGGSAEGLAWVEARPRKPESGFENLRLGLYAGQLRRMEMRDSFGQATVIVFTRLVANPALDPARFRFVPPAGADVIGDDVAPARAPRR